MIFSEELQLDLMRLFVKHSIIPDAILRNGLIRYEYRQMQKDKVRSMDAFIILGEKYFMSESNVQKILYTLGKDETI